MFPILPLRVFLPYCAQNLGGNTYVLIGRDYKPIGLPTREWSEWEYHPVLYEIDDLTPKAATEISWDRDPNTDRIYFYIDRCAPWCGPKAFAAYEARLTKFLELSIRPVLRNVAAQSDIGTAVATH